LPPRAPFSLACIFGLALALLPALAHAQPAEPPAPAPPPARISALTVTGSIDPPGRVEKVLARIAPPGGYFVEVGPADSTGTPVSTTGRLTATARRLGYRVQIATAAGGSPAAPTVAITVQLRGADRLRQIFVVGNWPLRQEDILRRLTSLRAGQELPDTGPARDARLERERKSILDYLHDRGYFEARVNFDLRSKPVVPAAIDLVVTIALGFGYPIGPIVVEGAHAISNSSIEDRLRRTNFLRLQPEPFNRQQLRQDLATLTAEYRDLGYAWVKINDEVEVDRAHRNVRLKLTVIERKKVVITYQGNNRFWDSDLEDVITIFTNGSYSSLEAQTSAEAIEQLYRSKGFLFTRVTWRADSSAPDVHRLNFSVVEGPSLKVREVAFEGARAFAPGRLADVVTVREFPWLGFLGIGEGGYASLRQLQLDVERLSGFYANAGYPGTTVACELGPLPGQYFPLATVASEAARFVNASGLYIRFVIKEAPRVDVAKIDFAVADGKLPLSAGFLLDSLDAKEGAPFRPEVVRSDSERLRRMMGDAGFPQAAVEASPRDRSATAKDIVYEIKLGPAERVGPLFLRGNFLTTEGTIRRWTSLSEGAPLTTSALEKSRRNLALVQILKNPNPISLVDEGEVDNVMPVLVEVEERHDHLGIVRVGGGASTEQQQEPGSFPLGAYMSLGYEHRNLFGRSWLFLTRAEFGKSLTRINSEFTNPRINTTQFRLHLNAVYFSQLTARLGQLRSGTGAVGLSRELTAGVDLTLYYNLRSTYSTEYLLRGAGADSEQDVVSIKTLVGALGLTLEWQRLDSPLVPTRGFKLQASVEVAEPTLTLNLGEDTFIKTGIRMLDVLPLSKRVSLRHSFRYDQGFPLRGASVLPKVERFFAGGDTTIRGFELDRARTDRVSGDIGPYATRSQYRPLGGSLRLLNNVDLQIQILGAWFGGVFIDTGVLADGWDGLKVSTFRHGAGIAPVVIKLPIGDLSIAWGWPLDPQPGDSRSGRLHFNVGLMF
jgi:outer membrane protein insertion porin family